MAYKFNKNKPGHFKGRKDEIISKLNGKLQRRTANLEVARQIKDAINANNGKAYNARIDKVFEAIAAKANASGQTGRGYITTRVQRKCNYGNGHYYIEVEIRNHESRFNCTDYESHWINVEISDYTRGRIQAETLEDPKLNEGGTWEIKRAIADFDEVADLYAKLCEVADQINGTSYLLRAELTEGVYISGIQNR